MNKYKEQSRENFFIYVYQNTFAESILFNKARMWIQIWDVTEIFPPKCNVFVEYLLLS